MSSELAQRDGAVKCREVWPAVTVLYGTAAGVLLHEHPYAAAVVLTLIWFAAVWRLRERRDPPDNC